MKEFSINDAAAYMGIGHNTLRKWISRGHVRHRVRDDGHNSVMLNRRTIDELMLLMEAFDLNARMMSVTLKIFARDPELRDEMLNKARRALEDTHE